AQELDEGFEVGVRIGVLREGGVLAQYDAPAAILAAPADDFVARFVGADRGLKRLALRRLDEIELDPADGAYEAGLRLAASATLRDALSQLLTSGDRQGLVVDAEGNAIGRLTIHPPS